MLYVLCLFQKLILVIFYSVGNPKAFTYPISVLTVFLP